MDACNTVCSQSLSWPFQLPCSYCAKTKYQRLDQVLFDSVLRIFPPMLVNSIGALRLSTRVCRYLPISSLTNLASNPWLSNEQLLRPSKTARLSLIAGKLSSSKMRSCLLIFLLGVINSSSRSFQTSSRRDKRDYYEVLGIPKSATARDVKKAYYSVCVQCTDPSEMIVLAVI